MDATTSSLKPWLRHLDEARGLIDAGMRWGALQLLLEIPTGCHCERDRRRLTMVRCLLAETDDWCRWFDPRTFDRWPRGRGFEHVDDLNDLEEVDRESWERTIEDARMVRERVDVGRELVRLIEHTREWGRRGGVRNAG